jgi:hypothetical protein
MEDSMPLDERMFRGHLADGPFQSGIDLKKWQLFYVKWPYAVISISAKPHEEWPSEYGFRFECSNYPDAAATAQPWDLENDTPLEPKKWPGGKDRVSKVFRPDWKEGRCLYLPCDRISIEGHPDWHTKHAHLIWKSTSDITLYLEAIHELLNSSDYTGPRGA